MYIFTPNTLIKSAEVNANFAEADTRLDIIESPAYAYGTLGGELSGNKTFTETANSGITKTSATVYTIVTAGLYHFYAQQLINSTGATNFFSKVNGASVHHGWHATIQKDIVTTFTKVLAVGDTITCNYDANVATVWTADHSVYYIYRIKAI